MSTDTSRANRALRTRQGRTKKPGDMRVAGARHRALAAHELKLQKARRALEEITEKYRELAGEIGRHGTGARLLTQVAKTLRNITIHAPETVTAAQLRNQAGEVLERVMTQGSVTITRHRRPSAVMLSIDMYESLLQSNQSPLNTLTAEFDALVGQMQTGKSKRAARSLFTASPAEFGKAAAAAAKPRG